MTRPRAGRPSEVTWEAQAVRAGYRWFACTVGVAAALAAVGVRTPGGHTPWVLVVVLVAYGVLVTLVGEQRMRFLAQATPLGMLGPYLLGGGLIGCALTALLVVT